MPQNSGSQQTTTPDTQAPELTSGSIATNGQDASTGLAAASVQARIEDAGSGFSYGTLWYRSDEATDQEVAINFRRENLVDGDNNNGLYTSSATFHENAANGQWTLTQAELRDETGMWTNLYGSDLSNWVSQTGRSDLEGFNLASSNPDIDDPVLSKIILGSIVKDSATGMFYIPVSVEASDNLSGIRDGSLRIAEINSGQNATAWFGGYNGSGSGTAAAPFQTSFVLSEYAASGTWALTDVWLYDEAGNYSSLWDTTLADLLSASGSVGSVAINNLNEDINDPELKSIKVITTTDEATGRALITLDLVIDEQNAGFSHGWIYFSEINGSGSFNTYISDTNLLSGSLHGSGGSYRISALAPEGYSDGDWQISRVELRDLAGNWWNSSDAGDTLLQTLKQAGNIDDFSLDPAIGGIPYQEYLSDIEAPEIDASSFSLKYVPDSRTGEGGRLFVELRAWDDVSGVNYISLNFTSSDGQTYNYNIDNAYAYLDVSNLSAEHNPSDEPLRGDTLNGWFRGSIDINQYAPSGDWSLTSAYITDRAGNSTSIYEDRSYSGNGYFGDDNESTDGFADWGFDPAALSFTVINTTPDNHAPDFSALSLPVNTITSADLDRYGQARLPFVVNIQDNTSGSGVQRVELQYKGPNDAWAYGSIYADYLGNGSLVSGDSVSGSFNGSIWLNGYNGGLQAGNYELASISIVDRAGNRTTYRDETLSGGGYFDNPSTVGSDGTDSLSDKLTALGLNASNLAFTYNAKTTNNPNPDTEAPIISAIKAWPYQTNKPAAIGLGDQQNALPIRVSATDASGIGNISFSFRNALYGDSWSTYLDLSDRNMTQGSTIRNGDFEGSIILNEYAQEGRWILDGMNISDIAGNHRGFWSLYDTTESGVLTQEALDQHAELAALGININELSFVAGDFVEPKAKAVTSGGQIAFDVYGMNQQANATLYWTANVNGQSTTPVAITLDALKQGSFTLNTNNLGTFSTDKTVFIDLWQDANKVERIGETARFTLKTIPAPSGGGGGGGGGGGLSPNSSPTPPSQIPAPITPGNQPALPPIAISAISEQAKTVISNTFVSPAVPPSKEQFVQVASIIKDALPSLVASGKISETSAEVLEALATGGAVETAIQSGRKSTPVKFGTESDDVITGIAGKGALQGGAGADAFTFIEQDRFGRRGSDRITDFNPQEGDKIVISPTAFPGMQEFRFLSISGRKGLKAALKSDATVIYIEKTGELYYNATPGASGDGPGGLFAVLNDRPSIGPEAFDFLNLANLSN